MYDLSLKLDGQNGKSPVKTSEGVILDHQLLAKFLGDSSLEMSIRSEMLVLVWYFSKN